MTSLAVNNGWTPELIAQDKALKEKYGTGAHITPAKTYVNLEKNENDSVEIDAKKDDKKVASPLIKGGLALGGAYGIGKSANNISSRIVKFCRPIRNKPGWRDSLMKLDAKLFEGKSKLSKFLMRQCPKLGCDSPASIVRLLSKSAITATGVGLAVYGGYQLIKGIANAKNS